MAKEGLVTWLNLSYFGILWSRTAVTSTDSKWWEWSVCYQC